MSHAILSFYEYTFFLKLFTTHRTKIPFDQTLPIFLSRKYTTLLLKGALEIISSDKFIVSLSQIRMSPSGQRRVNMSSRKSMTARFINFVFYIKKFI